MQSLSQYLQSANANNAKLIIKVARRSTRRQSRNNASPLINNELLTNTAKIMNYQLAKRKIVPNDGNLPLPEYYNSLETSTESGKNASAKTTFLEVLSMKVKRPVSTLRRWVAGTSTPAPLEKEAIAKLIKSDVETVFPS